MNEKHRFVPGWATTARGNLIMHVDEPPPLRFLVIPNLAELQLLYAPMRPPTTSMLNVILSLANAALSVLDRGLVTKGFGKNNVPARHLSPKGIAKFLKKTLHEPENWLSSWVKPKNN